MALVVQATFTVESDTDLASYTPETGTGFTKDAGSTASSTGTVLAATDDVSTTAFNNNQSLIYTADDAPGSANYIVTATLSSFHGSAGRNCGTIGRYADVDNCYLSEFRHDGHYLYKIVAGSVTSLGSYTAATPAAGDKHDLDMNGTAIKVDLNDTNRISVTDSDITATAKGGWWWGALHVGSWDVEPTNRLTFFEINDDVSGGNTATGASTLPSIASSGQGELTLAAGGVSVLPSMQQVAQALLVPDADGASLLPAMQQSGAVEEKFIANGAQALPKIQQAAQAFFGPDVSGAQTIPAIIQNAVVELILELAGASQLPSVLSSGVGFLLPEADGAQALPSIAMAGVAETTAEAAAASGASLLPAIASQASAELILIVSGASLLPALAQQGSLEEILAAAGASILPSIQSEAVVVLEISGVGVSILPAIRMEGSVLLVPDVTAAQLLPNIRMAGLTELVGAEVALHYFGMATNVGRLMGRR